MSWASWALIAGGLLITMALSGTALRRMPVSTAMLYLAIGYGLGPAGIGAMHVDPLQHSVALERVTEVAVLISLFTVGLKLGLPLSNKGWHLPVRLALISMTITVALIAAVGVFGLGLSLGAAVLLGAILAPTDPVLASDVQVLEAGDRDRLRFSLTGEGGLNDGTAFPFVMLGLGLLGLHDLGTGGWRWLVFDVVWPTAGGLAVGGVLGTLIGRLVVYLRSRHQEAVGLDEFLALGLVAVSYGFAVMLEAYGFLAVFAAGLALQRVKEPDGQTGSPPANLGSRLDTNEMIATDSKVASAYMKKEVRGFNEQLERIAEVAVVLIVGATLSYAAALGNAIWFVILVLVVLRPLSVWLGLIGAQATREQRVLISWFGIRGIGSIYYLMYSINHGLARPLAEQMIGLTFAVVVVSIVFHGATMTPLMRLYASRQGRGAPKP